MHHKNNPPKIKRLATIWHVPPEASAANGLIVHDLSFRIGQSREHSLAGVPGDLLLPGLEACPRTGVHAILSKLLDDHCFPFSYNADGEV